ncbi:hypothetical protein V5799_009556 [Amblyomma americanum]|uniref:Uncharacterized protein n=1 Tax=Amblyomma americanum TaxID=6943 RepID=A0AAQ4FA19_AMBAM
MNSAAVIGRQLRQQNTGRAGAAAASSLTAAASARARAPSHCNLIPAQTQQQLQQQQQQAHAASAGAAASQENKDESPATRWTWSCVWEACKALSGGIFLLALGTAMCVVGFFAEDLATSPVPRQGNATAASDGTTTSDGEVATTLVVDRNREYHLHNLSFAGPAIMGLGGIFIVAACVLTFEAKERPHHQRVVPVDEKRPSAAEVLIPVLAKTPQGTHLTVPAVWTTAGGDPGPSEPPRTLVLPAPPPPRGSNTTTSSRSSATASGGARRAKRGSLAGASSGSGSSSLIATRGGGTKTARTSLSSTTTFLLSPRYEEQFLPSPADLQIQDPDGCDTPADESLSSVSIELYARYSRMASPRLFASVESDGLSDSDDDDAATPGAYAPAGAFEDQVVPLLGRCSPQDLVYLPPPPSARSGGSKRFPLLRQSASNADGCSRGLNGRASADEMVPS